MSEVIDLTGDDTVLVSGNSLPAPGRGRVPIHRGKAYVAWYTRLALREVPIFILIDKFEIFLVPVGLLGSYYLTYFRKFTRWVLKIF